MDTAPATPAVEVVVQAESNADRLRHSAQAVTVVDTAEAKRESADVGQVMSRSSGVDVRRSGGLGSSARISLYGLTDEQIRFFENEVPLDFVGFGQGIANVPLNLVDRIEIYRGVVPVRFGADALGGAVNLASDESNQPLSAAASYQVGSYGLYRMTLSARRVTDDGLVMAGNAFVDRAKNDYPVDVELADELGRPYPARVRRFHDGYAARGASFDFGVLRKPWARKLMLKVFATSFSKELQHNSNMTMPYGEVEYGESVYGATLRYEKPRFITARLALSALAGYSRRNIWLNDDSPFVYDWRGRRVFERRPGARLPGELTGAAIDSEFREHRGLGRLGLSYTPASEQRLRLVSSPYFTARKGEDKLHRSSGVDELAGNERTFSMVTGLEYELRALEGRLENTAFLKDYLFQFAARKVDKPTQSFEGKSSDARQHLGFGDALRFRVIDGVWLKASYENATRLPRPDEVFGNGTTIIQNREILPERSDNANLGVAAELKGSKAGDFRGELNAALRDVDDLILLVPANDPTYAQYVNVAAVTSKGFDAALGWTSPRRYLTLDGNVTWFDLRNDSDQGPYRQFKGDRVPNRPWLLANGAARLRWPGLGSPRGELWLSWDSRYVGAFFNGWESAGRKDSKARLPSQLLHSAGIGYLLRSRLTISSSLEVQNLTDEVAYDMLGVQKLGRAVYFKGAAEF